LEVCQPYGVQAFARFSQAFLIFFQPPSEQTALPRQRMNAFEKNQVIVRDDGKFPSDALVVVGYEMDGSLLAHPLGGGLQFQIPADEVVRFSAVSEGEKTAIFSKGLFMLEGIEEKFEGWSDGTLWNGFEKPHFSKHTAVLVLTATGYKWKFEEAQNCFLVFGEDEDEPTVYAVGLISLPDGGTEKVYAIGAGDWIWDKV